MIGRYIKKKKKIVSFGGLSWAVASRKLKLGRRRRKNVEEKKKDQDDISDLYFIANFSFVSLL